MPEPTATAEPDPSPTAESTAAPTRSPAAATYSLLFEITNSPDNLKSPGGIAVDSAGNLFVWDAGKSRLLKFDSAGGLLEAWDSQGSGDGEFNSLGFGGIAIDGDDNVFVVDNGNFRIQKFDSRGSYVAQWGTQGTGDGQFERAIGIAAGPDGSIYVTD
ncbi:MAG: hypothetical protein ACK2UR_16970, partial [Candidatus Promineifilaceae bacterium]